jgi:HD-GYP domain-containing protein (c-di-GMP phosphodiesterase class II)
LTSTKTILGVINVRKKTDGTPFNEGDLELISILATQAAIAIENSRLFSDLNAVYLGVMQFIVALTEARDVYLRGHTQRVTGWCLRLGRALRLGKEELTVLKHAATLHDIGKLAISEAILNKPAKLTPQEFEIIKTHPTVGTNILKPLKFLKDTRQIVLHHHERLNGTGYPDGLSGNQINLPTSIIILADSYDAMNSDRAYRKALPRPQIIKEIISAKGEQFHPQVVDVFLKLLKGTDNAR